MKYINIISLIILLLVIILFVIYKRNRKKYIFYILITSIILGMIITWFPYNLVISFNEPLDGYKFYYNNKIIETLTLNKETIFIDEKFEFIVFKKDNKKWKEDIIKETTTISKKINNRNYFIKKLKLQDNRLLVVIIKNMNIKNKEYDSIELEGKNIKDLDTNKIYYLLINYDDNIYINGEKIF